MSDSEDDRSSHSGSEHSSQSSPRHSDASHEGESHNQPPPEEKLRDPKILRINQTLATSSDEIKPADLSLPTSRRLFQPPKEEAIALKLEDNPHLQYENRILSEEARNEPQKDLIFYPDGDVTLHTIKKTHRTQRASPSSNQDGLLDHTKISFELFGADWTYFQKNHTQYEQVIPKKGERLWDYPKNSFEHQYSFEKQSETDQSTKEKIYLEFLEPYDKEKSEEENLRERTRDQIHMFWLQDPDWSYKPGPELSLGNRIAQRFDPNKDFLHKQESCLQILVKMKNLIFQLGELEPFWCSLSLYDIDKKKKVSENFFFDRNSEPMRKIVENHTKKIDEETEGQCALFTITQPNPSIYLVLRVKKVLQGEIESSIDPYLKPPVKDKDLIKLKTKMSSEVKQIGPRTGSHRQFFAWAAIPLFHPNLSLNGEVKIALGPKSKFNTIYAAHPKDNIIDLLTDLKDPKRAKKFTQIPGYSEFDLLRVTRWFQNRRFDPSLDPVIWEPEEKGEKSNEEEDVNIRPSEILREIQEFPQLPILEHHWSYVNNIYIYPEALLAAFKDKKGKNIALKLELRSDDSLSEPLQSAYGSSSCEKINNHAWNPVSGNNRAPIFSEEFKFRLPEVLTEKHHILFTFYHISIKPPKNNKEDKLLYFLGHAILPLWTNRIVTNNQGTHTMISIFTNPVEKGYLTTKNFQYHENGQAVFKLRVELVSTVYSQHPDLGNLAQIYTLKEGENDPELTKVLTSLMALPPEHAVPFMPVTFYQLIKIMCSRTNQPGLFAFKALVMILIRLQGKIDTNRPTESKLFVYLQYVYDNPPNLESSVYKSLTTYFLMFMMEKKMNLHQDVSYEDFFSISWFLFDLIIRSMVLTLHKSGELGKKNYGDRFESGYYRVLKKLTSYTGAFLKNLIAKEETAHASHLNRNIGIFIRDLFSLCDRGVCIDLVHSYCQEFPPQERVSQAKYEFLKIVLDYEHYLPLNYPFYPSLENPTELLATTTVNHPLSSLISKSVIEDMKNPNIHTIVGLRTLSWLLAKHDYDKRYQSKERRERVALIYFPLILMMIQDLENLKNWHETASIEERREFYVCLFWLFKNIRRSFLREWWRVEAPEKILTFLDILGYAVDVFEYNQRIILPSVETILPDVILAERKQKEGQISTETSLLVLDFIEDLISDFYEQLSSTEHGPIELMKKLFRLLLRLLQKKQSERCFRCLFQTLKSFIVKFRVLLFTVQHGFIGELVREVLRLCNSASLNIRKEATACLYNMIRNNNLQSGEFTRTSVQATIALSQLVADGHLKHDFYLKRSLDAVIQYSLYEYGNPVMSRLSTSDSVESFSSYEKARFGRSIQEFSTTVAKILSDTIQVKEIQQKADPEMIADLYHSIAQGYRHTPDLRLTWLESLAKFQVKQENFPEAAMCTIHVAALILDYLSNTRGYTVDATPFKTICPSISEYAGHNENLCQSNYFSEEGLIQIIRLSITYLKQAELFEYANALYKIIIPIYERNRQWRELGLAHSQLEKYWRLISEKNESRLMGKYYRVGFWGSKFAALNRKEFVYREPGLTQLWTLKDRLQEFFQKLFGDKVDIWPDSSKIDPSKLDPQANYLQLTSVEPYFEPENLATRTSYFKKNTNLSQFIFVTPFTKGTKAQGGTADQYKRKTIITVANQFPFMMKRLPVISKREIIQDPLEVSLEQLEQRIAALAIELAQKPPNPKTLQQILQGSVIPQVNAGPMEIARVFLGNELDYAPEAIELVRLRMEELLDVCADGIKINETLITPDQRFFQEELKNGLRESREKLSPFLDRTVARQREERQKEQTQSTSEASDESDEEEDVLDV